MLTSFIDFFFSSLSTFFLVQRKNSNQFKSWRRTFWITNRRTIFIFFMPTHSVTEQNGWIIYQKFSFKKTKSFYIWPPAMKILASELFDTVCDNGPISWESSHPNNTSLNKLNRFRFFFYVIIRINSDLENMHHRMLNANGNLMCNISRSCEQLCGTIEFRRICAVSCRNIYKFNRIRSIEVKSWKFMKIYMGTSW